MRDAWDIRDPRDLRDARDVRDKRDIWDPRDLRDWDPRDLRDQRDLRDTRDTGGWYKDEPSYYKTKDLDLSSDGDRSWDPRYDARWRDERSIDRKSSDSDLNNRRPMTGESRRGDWDAAPKDWYGRSPSPAGGGNSWYGDRDTLRPPSGTGAARPSSGSQLWQSSSGWPPSSSGADRRVGF